jgi:proline iminopeptidase
MEVMQDLIEILFIFLRNRMPYLDVGDGHTMYYETHGAPDGIPIVLLHGGPGGGMHKWLLTLFDLKKWFVVMYDQRGCGKSLPRLELKANTTWHLVEDIEKLRYHLGVNKWAICGGSWGSTLAFAYAAKYLDRILGFVLRGICLVDDGELDWMYGADGAAQIYPDEWKKFVAASGRASGLRRRNITFAFSKKLANRRTRRRAAAAWWGWEAKLSKLRGGDGKGAKGANKFMEEIATLENYYFLHGAWLQPGQLLAAVKKIPATTPVHLVQGRYDLVCPARSALSVAKAIPHSKLHISVAGHSTFENKKALQKAISELYRELKH